MGGHGSGLFLGVAVSANSELDTKVCSDNKQKIKSDELQVQIGSVREILLSKAATEETRRIIKELYRPNATVGDGGTADAIRKQLRTGNFVGKKDHMQKGRERLKQIVKILARNPDHPDKVLLEKLKNDLTDALGGNK